MVFDGEWTTHSNKLITKLGQRLVNVEGAEFLIMDQLGFTPGGWDSGQQDMMFRVHEDWPSGLGELEGLMKGEGEGGSGSGSRERLNETFPDDDLSSGVLDRMQYPEKFPEWAFDFSSTYLVHAYKIWEFSVDGFDKLDPRYVLQRQSNFARAVYPAALDAYRRGMFELDDEWDA